MRISAQELAQMLNGTIEGNPDITISQPSKIEEGGEGTISFLANAKYEHYAYTTTASILLVSKDFQASKPIAATLIRVEDVYSSIGFLLNKFGAQQNQVDREISPQASIHAEAKIGKEVAIGPFVVIQKGAQIADGVILHPQVFIGKNVVIKENTIVYPGAKIHRGSQIGAHCIIHANAVIGSDGFGFAPQQDGTYKKIAQLGNVVLEDQVDIGANTVIDRATMGLTIIRKGVKLDNLIQIAHNVDIGENTVIAAQAGIAGSTEIGQDCQIGGQAGFVGHIKVANGTKVQAQSGVAAGIEKENTAIYGSPALPYSNYLKSYALFKNFPEWSRQIRQMAKRIKELEGQ